MADGYSLEVNADLDQSKYRRDVEAMKAFTKAQGLEMEKSLNITARVDDNASKTIQKINAEKIASKEFLVDANVERALAEVGGLEASIQGNPVDIPVTADTSIALGELETLQGVAQANPIDIPVTTSGGGRAAIQGLSTDLVTASRGAEQVTSRLGTMALVAGGVGAAFAGIGLAVGGFGVAVAAQLDSAIFGFKRLVGNAGIADAALRDLKETATETPFAIGDVLNVGFRLKAAGRDVKGLSDDVRTLSDALVVSGGSAAQLEGVLFAIQQTRGTGRVEQRDLRQIANNIPSFAAGQFESYVAEAKKAGKSGADALIEAIFIGLKKIPGAAGASAAATEETFVGKFSNFKDKIQLQFLDAFTPNKDKIFKALDQVTAAVGPALAKLAPVAVDALAALGPIIAKLITGFAPIVGVMTEVFVILANRIIPAIDLFSQKIKAGNIDAEKLASIFGGLVVGGVFLKISAGILAVITPLANLVGALGGISGIISSLVAPFTWLGEAIATTVGGIGSFVTAIGAAGGGISGLTAVTGGLLAALGPVGWIIAGVGAGIAAIVVAIATTKNAFSSLRETVVSLFNQVKPGIVLIGQGLKDAFVGVVAALRPFGILLINIFKLIANTHIIQGLVTILGVVAQSIGKVIGGIGKFVGLIGKIPFLNKIVGDSFDESSKKIDKQKEAADKLASAHEAMQKRIEAANKRSKESTEKFRTDLNTFLSAGLPPIDTTSLTTMQKSLETSLATVKKRSADIKTVIAAGFPDLAQQALEIGGDQGTQMMSNFAKAIADHKPEVLKEYRDTLLELKKQQAIAEAIFKKDKKNIQSSIDFGVFDALGGQAQLNTLLSNVEKGKKGAVQALKDFEKEYKLSSKNNVTVFKDQLAAIEAIRKAPGGDLFIGPPSVPPKPAKPVPVGPNTEGKTGFEIPTTGPKGVPVGPNTEGKTGLQSAQEIQTKTEQVKQSTEITFANIIASAKAAGIRTPTEFINGLVSTWGPGVNPKARAKAQELADILSGNAKTGGEKFAQDFATKLLGQLGTYNPSFQAAGKKISAFIAPKGFIVKDAGAKGKTNWKGGPILVGELGPEIVNLPDGSDIIPHNQSKQIINSMVFPRLENGTPDWAGGFARVGERPGGEDVYLPKGSKVVPAHKTVDLEARSSGDTYHTEVHGVSFDQAVAEWDAKTRAKRRQAFV